MVRSAAKNHARVTVVCDPRDYARVLDEVERLGDTTPETRAELAAKAFAHTAAYDGAIAAYLSGRPGDDRGQARFPQYLTLAVERAYGLRYGENPHQGGAFYVDRGAPAGSLARAESLGAGGKELSFNNLVDLDAALDAVREFTEPAAVVVKHTNPCGVATAPALVDSYRAAREADPVSAFGGIVALNREVDDATAAALTETFVECVVAPSFAPGALETLRAKKNLRLLATGAWLGAAHAAQTSKRVSGGLVVQDRDATAAGEVSSGRTATRRAPTPEELRLLDFAVVRLQARQVQRHRARPRRCPWRGDRRRGRRSDVPRHLGPDRVREGRRCSPRERPRLRCLLPLSRRGRGRGAGGRRRHRAARGQRARRRGRRRRRCRRDCDGLHGRTTLPPLNDGALVDQRKRGEVTWRGGKRWNHL